MQVVTNAKGQKAYRIVFNVEMPVLNRGDDTEIVYFYSLELPGRQNNSDVIYENRLLLQRKVRYVDLGSSTSIRPHSQREEMRMMMMMGAHRRPGADMNRMLNDEENQTPIEIIDGILEFGGNENLEPERIRLLKQDLLRDQLQLDYLKSPVIIDPTSNVLQRLLKKAQDLERFVLKDTESLKLFEEVK